MNLENTLPLVGGGEGKLRSSGVIAIKAGGVGLGAGSYVDATIKPWVQAWVQVVNCTLLDRTCPH